MGGAISKDQDMQGIPSDNQTWQSQIIHGICSMVSCGSAIALPLWLSPTKPPSAVAVPFSTGFSEKSETFTSRHLEAVSVRLRGSHCEASPDFGLLETTSQPIGSMYGIDANIGGYWGYIDGKCFQIWHTWILWAMIWEKISNPFSENPESPNSVEEDMNGRNSGARPHTHKIPGTSKRSPQRRTFQRIL